MSGTGESRGAPAAPTVVVAAAGAGITWLGTKEASALLGLTLRSLYRFIDEGDLPAYKFGRVIRLKESDVLEFIEACRVTPGSLEHLYPPLKAVDGRDGVVDVDVDVDVDGEGDGG